MTIEGDGKRERDKGTDQMSHFALHLVLSLISHARMADRMFELGNEKVRLFYFQKGGS
jgi:hypothetical protein